MSMTTTVPFSHYRILWATSWLSFASSLYGAAMGQPYNVYMVPTNIFITSMLYWPYPVRYTWRYYADVFVTHFMILYAIYRAANAEYMGATYFIWMGVPISHLLSEYYYMTGRYDESVAAHAVLHFLGNLGNFIIYSGKFMDFCDRNAMTPRWLLSCDTYPI